MVDESLTPGGKTLEQSQNHPEGSTELPVSATLEKLSVLQLEIVRMVLERNQVPLVGVNPYRSISGYLSDHSSIGITISPDLIGNAVRDLVETKLLDFKSRTAGIRLPGILVCSEEILTVLQEQKIQDRIAKAIAAKGSWPERATIFARLQPNQLLVVTSIVDHWKSKGDCEQAPPITKDIIIVVNTVARSGSLTTQWLYGRVALRATACATWAKGRNLFTKALGGQSRFTL